MKKEKQPAFQRRDWIILIVILIIAAALRQYKVNTPLADLHSWRQVDTAAVARNYARNGIDWLHPRYDDLSSLQTGHENPEGLRYVEFPIYNAIVGFIGSLLKSVPIEVIGRNVSAVFSLFIITAIYYLCLKETDRVTAAVAASVYAVFPAFVFFSRMVLPETTALSFAMISVMLTYMGLSREKTGKYILLLAAALSMAASLLVKPTTIFYGIAIIFLFFRHYRLRTFKQFDAYLFAAIAVLPLAAWRYFISFHPEGIPPSDWLITSVNTYEGLRNVFLKPAFFRWIFYERVSQIIFGGYLVFFFIMGLMSRPRRWLPHMLVLSGMAYLFVFEGGNVQHEYYQTILLPALAIPVGMGTAYVVANAKNLINVMFVYLLMTVLFALSLFFSFYRVREYYSTPSDLPPIANIIKTLTNPNDKIVTDRLGDTTLLYLADRKGAPAIYKDPATLKTLGYKYLVTMNRETINQYKDQEYRVVFENDKFAMFAL